MLLSIVIPALNPETYFLTQIAHLIKSRPDFQVIIVDDFSDVDIANFLPHADNLILLRNDKRRGAGFNRNLGIKHAIGTYTVFMDDDDAIDWAVIDQLILMMDAQPSVDMSVSSYRFLRDGKTHPAWPDYSRILNHLLNGQSCRVVGIDGNEDILRLNNFPWTKFYRTEFIRRIHLRFSETFVQNDIFAHWQSILFSQRILITNLVQCTQTINKNGNRVNNTNDARRLEAFIALRETYEMVRERGLLRAEAMFWKFYEGLARWMISVSSLETRAHLMKEHVSFSGMMPPYMDRIHIETGMKRWEIWDMNYLENLLPLSSADSFQDETHRDICLTEISRLKRLATELRVDNDRLHKEINSRTVERDRATSELRTRTEMLSVAQEDCRRYSARIEDLDHQVQDLGRHVNSKAAQLSFKMRRVYRVFVPFRGNQK